MTIYTAGYKQGRCPPQAVNIARYPHKNFPLDRPTISVLAPNDEVWKCGKADGDWRAAYMRQLDRLWETGRLAQAVAQLKDGDVLMCWERNARDCHRVIAAHIISQHFPEITYAGEHKDKPWQQRARDTGQELFSFLL